MLNEITPVQLSHLLKAIQIMTKLGEIRSCMAKFWLKPRSKKKHNVNGAYPEDIITRAVALAARQTHRVDLMQGLSDHPDPEVRVHVAYAAAEPDKLCDLLIDTWPIVQRAAVIGIEKIKSPSGLCLLDRLSSMTADIKERQ